jgi:hypothetical protein
MRRMHIWTPACEKVYTACSPKFDTSVESCYALIVCELYGLKWSSLACPLSCKNDKLQLHNATIWHYFVDKIASFSIVCSNIYLGSLALDLGLVAISFFWLCCRTDAVARQLSLLGSIPMCGMPEENTKRLIRNQIFALCIQMFAIYTTLVSVAWGI